MRLLHTADWHLGRTLCGQPFHEEQQWLLTGPFLDIVRDTRPELILVAGDIYDRAVPPADSVELLNDVLTQLVRGLGVPVVMIAGNHDDARRLAAYSRLLDGSGLLIADSALGQHFAFEDSHGPIAVLAAGYGSPALVSSLLGPDARVPDHDAGFAAVAANLRGLTPAGARTVAVAHAFIAGGLESESERLLQVGGSGAVSAAHLAGFHYTALGHLHRRQDMMEGRVAYSGSPLAYSFSEAGGEKSVTLVEIGAQGDVSAEHIPIVPRHPLRVLRGTLQEVLDAAAGPGREDWLEVELTDRRYGAMGLLRERYPNLLNLRFQAPEDLPSAIDATGRRMAESPLATLEAFWAAIGQPSLSEAESAAAHIAIERAQAEMS